CPNRRQKIAECREGGEKIVEYGKGVYGMTTGFGKFSDVLIRKDDVKALQHNLIPSHACGIGDPFPHEVSRGRLILR
ncbi:aromatic amino acid lyase, partial [Bacillus tropicus]|uniref:aromatic amino acid lyase n=1 Tax=Bacillus tropicus TaxID=2026188 RepID=UPI00284CEB3B